MEAAFACSASDAEQLKSATSRLAYTAQGVPKEARNALRPHLERVADHEPEQKLRLFGGSQMQGRASLALAFLFPEMVNDKLIRSLVSGNTGQRSACAQLLAARREPADLTLLTMLRRDPEFGVRASAAEALTSWVVQRNSDLDAIEVLKQSIDEPGTRLGIRVSGALSEEDADPKSVEILAELLKSHPSATVRARAQTAIIGRSE